MTRLTYAIAATALAGIAFATPLTAHEPHHTIVEADAV
jgi:hypothetical protein